MNKYGFLLISSTYLYLNKDYNNSIMNQEDTFKTAKKAICILDSKTENNHVKAIVEFGQIKSNCPVHIKGQFSGLNKNWKHGFHIHQWGNLSNGCISAGPHFNPENKTHGGPNSEIRHVGDLGNVVSDENGNANYELVDEKLTLFGINSIIGRSLVLHQNEDDLGLGNSPDSKTTGNSGARIACGVIGLTEFTKNDLNNYLF